MPLSNEDKSYLENFIKANHLDIKIDIGFENFSRNINLPDNFVLEINNIKSLQAILHEIYQLNENKPNHERIVLRVAAGNNTKNNKSYSFTEGAVGDVIVRLQGEEFKKITQTAKKNIFKVGGSVQIGELDKILYEKYRYVLPTSPLIPYVSVGGFTANAGHGTGKKQPAFPGLIRSMTFCLPNGKITRIDKSHKNFEIIRGAHLGLFGILLEVELECSPAKKLQCVMEARSLAECIEEIKEGLFLHDPYVSIMYIPTYQSDELTNKKLKNVIIYRWRPVDLEVNEVNSHPVLSSITQDLEVKLQEEFHISDLLRLIPGLIPYYMKYLVTRVTVGTKDSIAVVPWPQVHYRTAYPHEINDIDYLFEVSSDYHEITDALVNFSQKLTEHRKKNQYPVSGAVYIRLFGGTNGGLSTSYHSTEKEICAFDIVSTPGIKGYEKFRDAMDDYFLTNLDARPHWGKLLPSKLDVEKIYGENYYEFLSALENWYQEHQMKLSNSMLMSAFFVRLLHLNPNLFNKKDIAFEQAKPIPCLKAHEMAKKLLAVIEEKQEKDHEAEHFKKRLHDIATHPLTCNNQLLFKMRENYDDKKEVLKKRCVII